MDGETLNGILPWMVQKLVPSVKYQVKFLKELDAIKAQPGPDRQGEPSTAVRSAPSTENKLACSEDSA